MVMCMDMRMDMFVDMCMGMRIDVCTHMHVGVCVGMHLVCAHVDKHACAHVLAFTYTFGPHTVYAQVRAHVHASTFWKREPTHTNFHTQEEIDVAAASSDNDPEPAYRWQSWTVIKPERRPIFVTF